MLLLLVLSIVLVIKLDVILKLVKLFKFNKNMKLFNSYASVSSLYLADLISKLSISSLVK